MTTDLGAKRLGLLRELVPTAKLIGLLVNPNSPEAPTQRRDAEVAANTIGRKILGLDVGSERDFEPAFVTLTQARAGALLVSPDPFFTSRREQLVALAARYELPVIYEWRDFVAVGGLMSYGTDIADAYRQAGVYAGRILNGTKTGDLPVMQSTKFELVINLKTAKALGPDCSSNIARPRRRGHRMIPKHPPGSPMTLGNMREQGVHHTMAS